MDTAPDALPEALAIPLRKPITLGQEAYKTLELREPTAAEMLQWDKLDGVEADVKAVSIVSGWPEPVVRQLGARDFIRASRFIASFLS
jgi:hypothetical protein